MSQLTDGEIRQVMPHLQRFALWLTRNPHSAEDLVQSCLTKALTRRQQNEDEQSLRAWLFTILYRQFIDGERRRKRYMKLLNFFTGEEAFGHSSESLAHRRRYARAVRRLADRIPRYIVAGERGRPEL
ncbi:RNA polymerase sigma factor [Dryocola sp. BD586]|uniref:RNA polymerase sigma factor n=1 Tax=Dryocola sp. BD586 TaxID=3133271 RepID=UPI003F50A043